MCLLVAHSRLWIDHRQVALGCGRPCFCLFSLAEQLLNTRVRQDAIGTVSSNRSRVCMFLRKSLLEPYTAVQVSRPAAISWGGLVFDLVFRSRTPSITFSDTSTNRFWAAVWPSAITWRSKVLRPPFWPLGQFFRCRLPPCLRRNLRTNAP